MVNRRLTDLQENQWGEITQFSDDVMASRMMSMGILPGSCICMMKKAPMKGGICLKVDNNKVALRCCEADSILIKA
ncbi:MAG: Fe2+ transport system protein FeoA [Cognaticolwellia sp.]|jgi:Fe2+ transport system protein FeoA|tara:strand:- start:30 stop:257 length:228 start_codon:yes stop_codon:yes gene_type:complete